MECSSLEDYNGSCNGVTQKMGYPCTSAPGIGRFFLNVNSEEPYAQG